MFGNSNFVRCETLSSDVKSLLIRNTIENVLQEGRQEHEKI